MMQNYMQAKNRTTELNIYSHILIITKVFIHNFSLVAYYTELI